MNRTFLTLTMLALVSAPRVARARDWFVPDPIREIQTAIDSAYFYGGDRVIVTKGVESQYLYLPFVVQKPVEVLKNTTEEIIVDGSNSTYAAWVNYPGAKISGLTLKGGTTNGVLINNGGTVDNCKIIDDGTAYSNSAVQMSSGVLENCVIELTSGYAQAVEIPYQPYSPVKVTGNTITISDARVTTYVMGDDCSILDNTFTRAAGGVEREGNPLSLAPVYVAIARQRSLTGRQV
jgi:hypothetical protein